MEYKIPVHPLFETGALYITPPALEAFSQPFLFDCLLAHMSGQWGELDQEDKEANDAALVHGLRIVSSYKDENDSTLWIITEADRHATTLMLPSDY